MDPLVSVAFRVYVEDGCVQFLLRCHDQTPTIPLACSTGTRLEMTIKKVTPNAIKRDLD